MINEQTGKKCKMVKAKNTTWQKKTLATQKHLVQNSGTEATENEHGKMYNMLPRTA